MEGGGVRGCNMASRRCCGLSTRDLALSDEDEDDDADFAGLRFWCPNHDEPESRCLPNKSNCPDRKETRSAAERFVCGCDTRREDNEIMDKHIERSLYIYTQHINMLKYRYHKFTHNMSYLL